ncbi:unnamed protein product [Phytophthora fragariaefolia]|uniref:Unnamed protein product n=1 Tax=Phytophthora fragariaefolia TaxID=1490495 RepID=A0A9W6TL65_9STRA|nr:unnamed protein product [Phytophthora fragariaefolia]
MLQQLHAQSYTPSTGFKLKAPMRVELIAWRRKAWSTITPSTIVNEFYKAKLVLERAPPSPRSRINLEVLDINWDEHFGLVGRFNVQQQLLERRTADPARDIETLSTEEEA